MDYSLSGLFIGLAAYTFLTGAAGCSDHARIHRLLVLGRSGRHTNRPESSLARNIVLLVTAVITVAPLAVTYLTNPAVWSHRTAEVTVLRDIRAQGSLQPLLLNVVDVLKSFHQWGDTNGLQNLPGEPMMDPLTGVFFGVGVAYSLFRWRDHRSVLLLLWTLVGMAGSCTQSARSVPAESSCTSRPASCSPDCRDRPRPERPPPSRFPAASFSTSQGPMAIQRLRRGVCRPGTCHCRRVGKPGLFRSAGESEAVLRMYPLARTAVAHETVAAGLRAGDTVYLWHGYTDDAQLRFLVYGVYKTMFGRNSLLDLPYHFLDPAWDLPLVPDGRDALILFDPSGTLSDQARVLYPGAQVDLVRFSDSTLLYLRIRVPAAQIAELEGLVRTITFVDGAGANSGGPQTSNSPNERTWPGSRRDGVLRIEQDGEYSLVGEGGLQIVLDNAPWSGRRYLGRGTYALNLTWEAGADSAGPGLQLANPDSLTQAVPARALMHLRTPPQGLHAAYYPNTAWQGLPVFTQTTPILDLGWPYPPSGGR